LRLQRGAIGGSRTQVQVQCILDPQQVFLQRCRYRVQQGTVPTRQAAAGMFEFSFGRCLQKAWQRILGQSCGAARGAELVEQRQQHDRYIAMAALQALQVVRELDDAAHQRRTCFIKIAGLASNQRLRQLFHFLGHHGRRTQFKHAQRALHLM
jgi:hypothetical protein